MDWRLQELYLYYRMREVELSARTRPPLARSRRRMMPLRQRLARSFVRLGVRIDAEASVAVLRMVSAA